MKILFIAKLNGFHVTQRAVGHKDTYFMAYRKNDKGVVERFCNKRLSNLENKVIKQFSE